MGIIAILAAYMLNWLAEGRIHRQNYQFLVQNGGEEKIPLMMRSYYLVNFFAYPLMAAEWYFFKNAVESPFFFIGFPLLGLALFLRVTVLSSLGRYWSRRCIFMKGYPRIENGPFRFTPNPEYCARILEIIGFGLVTTAYFTLTFSLILTTGMVVRIIRIEAQQLRQLSTTWHDNVAAYRASRLDQGHVIE
jgi:methyltransferase